MKKEKKKIKNIKNKFQFQSLQKKFQSKGLDSKESFYRRQRNETSSLGQKWKGLYIIIKVIGT